MPLSLICLAILSGFAAGLLGLVRPSRFSFSHLEAPGFALMGAYSWPIRSRATDHRVPVILVCLSEPVDAVDVITAEQPPPSSGSALLVDSYYSKMAIPNWLNSSRLTV